MTIDPLLQPSLAAPHAPTSAPGRLWALVPCAGVGSRAVAAPPAAPAGSTVRVELDGATVAVQDSGPGVPDYALPRLGERFFTTARPGGERSGSGLGLAIVQRVMALHGGQMVARNTGPGLRVALEFRRA